MAGIEIEIQSPYGAKVGAGPITTGRNWQSSPRMNKVGKFSFEMPLSDARRSLLAQKRYVRCFGMVSEARAELGKPGIIDSIKKVLDANGVPTGMIRVKGRDLFAELVDINIHELNLIDEITRSPDRMEYWDGQDEGHFIPHGEGPFMEYAYDGNDETGVQVPADDEDDLYVGDDDPFDIVNYANISLTLNTDPTSQSVRYWNGSSWASGTILADTTKSDGATWGQNGSIRWERQDDWAKCEVNGQNKYWLRFNFGEDLSDDLTLFEVTVTQEIPTATALADWLAYTNLASETPISTLGWDFWGTHDTTEGTIFLKFRDISAFEALALIAEQAGENFRLGTGRVIEWLQSDKIASGVRATNVESGVAAQANADICIITSLEETEDSYELGSRIYPQGGGRGAMRITLGRCTDAAPEGYTLNKAANFLEKDGVAEAYGRPLELTKFWPNMVSPNWASARDANTSNALLKLAHQFLSRHYGPQVSYKFSVVKLDSEVKVGETIQLHYWETVDGEAVWDLGVASALHLWVLEITHSVDAAGTRVVAMQIATVDAWPASAASKISALVSQLKAMQSTDAPIDAENLILATFQTFMEGATDHRQLTGVSANQHHSEAHVMPSTGPHSASGLSTGHVLRASGATAFSWAQLQHTDLGGVSEDQHHNAFERLTGDSGVAVPEETDDGITIAGGTLITTVAADNTVTIGLTVGGAQYQVPVTGADPYTPAWTALTAFAGAGLGWTDNAFAVGAGDGIAVAADSIAVDLKAAWSGLEFNDADLRVDLDALYAWTALHTYAAGIESSNYASGLHGTGWGISHAGHGDFRSIYADEMHVAAFIADIYSALAGALIITKSRARVSSDFTIPNTDVGTWFYVEDHEGFEGDPVFVVNDYVCLRIIDTSGGGLVVTDVYGQVTDNHDQGGGEQRWWFVTTTEGYSSADVIYRGSIVLDYGQLGASSRGVWMATVLDAAGAPYSQVQTWSTISAGEPATFVTHVRSGNLDGIGGVGLEYGFWAGQGTTVNDPQILLTDSSAALKNLDFEIYASGTKVFLVDYSVPSLALGAAVPTGYMVGNGIWMGKDTVYKMRVGTVSGAALTAGWSWDGSTLLVKGQIVIQAGSSGIASLSDAGDLATADDITLALVTDSGALAAKASVDLATGEVTNKTATNIAETATRKWPTANQKAGGGYGYAGLDSSGDVKRVIQGAKLAAGSAQAGLNLTSTHMGYYDGSNWTVYLSSGGDFLFSKTGGASLLWDVSAGKLIGRNSSAVMQWETDATTGALKAGGGVVKLDATGLTLAEGAAGANMVRWLSGATAIGAVHTSWGGGAGDDIIAWLIAEKNVAGQNATVILAAADGAVEVRISVNSNRTITLGGSADLVLLPGGLDIGAAADPHAGPGAIFGKNNANASLDWIIDAGSTTGYEARVIFRDRGASKWTIGKEANNTFAISEWGAGVRLAIAAGGAVVFSSDVTIGGGAPWVRLGVRENASGEYVAWLAHAGDNADRHGMVIQCGTNAGGGGANAIIFVDGDVGPCGYIHINNQQVSLDQPSDVRLKKDIIYTLSVMDRLRAVQVRDFTMKRSGGRIRGFIAQELMIPFPEMVGMDGKSKMYYSQPGKLVPVLVKGIQEVDSEVIAIKAAILVMQQRLDDIERIG